MADSYFRKNAAGKIEVDNTIREAIFSAVRKTVPTPFNEMTLNSQKELGYGEDYRLKSLSPKIFLPLVLFDRAASTQPKTAVIAS